MEISALTGKPLKENVISAAIHDRSSTSTEFIEKLSLFEKGQITSLNPELDLAIYKDIVPHNRIPWQLYELVYERSSLIYNAVNNTADTAIQAGFELDSSTDAKKKIRIWFDKVNFELILANILKQLQIFGNAYLEVSDMDFPKLLHPSTMYVRVVKGGSQDGRVLGYTQIVGVQKIEFDKKDIIHFKVNDCCNNFYGMSELKPILGSLTRYSNWTEDLGEILHHLAEPYLHHKLGTEDFPATQEQIGEYQAKLSSRPHGEDWVTSSAVEITSVTEKQKFMQVDNLVKQLQDEIIAGLRVPEFFVRGGENSNKAIADKEMEPFINKVMSLVRTVVASLEDNLFPMLTAGKVKIKWNEISAEGEKAKAERFQLYTSGGMPLKTSMEIVGLGPWIEKAEKEIEEQGEQPLPFNKDEQEIVKKQKEFYRFPLEEKKVK